MQVLIVAGEGSMIIFSSNSMSSMGGSADRKALTVTGTLSGLVHLGKVAMIICSNYQLLCIGKVTGLTIDEPMVVEVVKNKDLVPQLGLMASNEIASLFLEH